LTFYEPKAKNDAISDLLMGKDKSSKNSKDCFLKMKKIARNK
jgi:hypothetical protein